MSDQDEDRGESYLEVQMDRSTLVAAGVGILALLVVAFFAGRWTAPSSGPAERDQGSERGDAATDVGGDDSAIEEESTDVDSEPHFGSRPVSAANAPLLTEVPRPASAARGETSSSATRTTTRAATTSTTVRVASTATTRPSATATTRAATTSTTRAAAAAATGAADGPWIVQVAASKSSDEAERLRRELERRGHPVRIVEEGGYFKVHVGPFDRRAAADEAERRLKREGHATWLKRP